MAKCAAGPGTRGCYCSPLNAQVIAYKSAPRLFRYMKTSLLAVHERMARVRHAHTSPELAVRRYLHAQGFRYRACLRSLPGAPDIVLCRQNAVIFVHGCFWHRHKKCPRASNPRSHADFWQKKFRGNVKRDKRNARRLRALGWHVFTIWECQTSSHLALQSLLRRLQKVQF